MQQSRELGHNERVPVSYNAVLQSRIMLMWLRLFPMALLSARFSKKQHANVSCGYGSSKGKNAAISNHI
jgi:hypothetical protein